MSRPADTREHAVHCPCPRCARLARRRGARFAIALGMLSGILVLLAVSFLLRSLL